MMSPLTTFALLSYEKLDFRILSVCTVERLRTCQNVVRLLVTYFAVPRLPIFFSYHIIFTPSMIYY